MNLFYVLTWPNIYKAGNYSGPDCRYRIYQGYANLDISEIHHRGYLHRYLGDKHACGFFHSEERVNVSQEIFVYLDCKSCMLLTGSTLSMETLHIN